MKRAIMSKYGFVYYRTSVCEKAVVAAHENTKHISETN